MGNSPFGGWESSDVVILFSSLLPYPVSIDNIARAPAMAEILFGWGKKFHPFFYFYADWGTGGGIVYRGRIVRGVHRTAGEIGHTVVDVGGFPVTVGTRGVWNSTHPPLRFCAGWERR